MITLDGQKVEIPHRDFEAANLSPVQKSISIGGRCTEEIRLTPAGTKVKVKIVTLKKQSHECLVLKVKK